MSIVVSRYVGVAYEGDRFCRELVRRVLADHGIALPEVDRPEDAEGWSRVPRAQPLDVVVFNRAGLPAHIGVCVRPGHFLHVEEGRTARIDRLSDPLHSARIEGFYRCTGAPCPN